MNASGNDHAFFSEGPPPIEVRRRVELIRVPWCGLPGQIILSEKLPWSLVHYWRGRSTPCQEDEGCEACAAGRVARVYGYLGIQDAKSARVGILEVTAPVCTDLHAVRVSRGSLRGTIIDLHRKPRKSNGAMYVEVKTELARPHLLAECPDTIGILSKMWEAKGKHGGTPEGNGAMDTEKLLRDNLRSLPGQLRLPTAD